MRPFRTVLPVLAAALLLTACATPASDDANAPPAMAGEPAAPPSPPEATPPESPAMTCDASKVQWTLGKVADEALVARAKAESTSERVRVIKPGMAVTMDYREDRLNLDVDAAGKVTRAYCG